MHPHAFFATAQDPARAIAAQHPEGAYYPIAINDSQIVHYSAAGSRAMQRQALARGLVAAFSLEESETHFFHDPILTDVGAARLVIPASDLEPDAIPELAERYDVLKELVVLRIADQEKHPKCRWIIRKLIVALVAFLGIFGLLVFREPVVSAAGYLYQEAARQITIVQDEIAKQLGAAQKAIGYALGLPPETASPAPSLTGSSAPSSEPTTASTAPSPTSTPSCTPRPSSTPAQASPAGDPPAPAATASPPPALQPVTQSVTPVAVINTPPPPAAHAHVQVAPPAAVRRRPPGVVVPDPPPSKALPAAVNPPTPAVKKERTRPRSAAGPPASRLILKPAAKVPRDVPERIVSDAPKGRGSVTKVLH